MRRKVQLLVVGLLALLLAAGVMAQDATEEAGELCTTAELLDSPLGGPGPEMTIREALKAANDDLNAKADEGNIEGWLQGARGLTFIYGMLHARCQGRYFTSEIEGEEAIIGPITFPSGIWKSTFIYHGEYGSMQFTDLQGDCDMLTTGSLYIMTASTDADGEEKLMEFENCVALIEMNDDGGAWELFFEPIQLTNE